jgi:hypothetical protein
MVDDGREEQQLGEVPRIDDKYPSVIADVAGQRKLLFPDHPAQKGRNQPYHGLFPGG